MRGFFPPPSELIHLHPVGNAARASGDNVGRYARVCASRHAPRSGPCTISLFPIFKKTLVTTQQASTAPRKSLTLIQLLGLIGAAGLIASILLNHLV
jgi:hypothetical protein